MQFMDDAIQALLQRGLVSPYEAFMKAIDKNRFKGFLPPDETDLGSAPGSTPDDPRRLPGNFLKESV
jgi:twitching motility protein PilT